MQTIYYEDIGIRTRQGAYWFAVIMVIVAINAVVLYAVRTDDRVGAAVAFVWVLLVMMHTFRSLRQLGKLERELAQPTEAMKLLFRHVLTQPILGYLPLLFVMRG